MAIRKFEPRDTDAAVRLWIAACEQSHSFLGPRHWLELEDEMRRMRLPRLNTYVDDESGVRGFVSNFEEDLDALFVDPAHQGRGIGRRLLDHVKAREPVLALGVFAKNERGVKFYRREGFEIIGSRLDETSKETILGMKWKRK